MTESRYYERKVRYLDYLVNGEKAGGAGFARTEIMGERLKLSVTVKGLRPTDSFVREVELLGDDGGMVIGQIRLAGGSGSFEYQDIIPFQALQGFRITLGNNREILCRWQEERLLRVVEGKKPQVSEEPEMREQERVERRIQQKAAVWEAEGPEALMQGTAESWLSGKQEAGKQDGRMQREPEALMQGTAESWLSGKREAGKQDARLQQEAENQEQESAESRMLRSRKNQETDKSKGWLSGKQTDWESESRMPDSREREEREAVRNIVGRAKAEQPHSPREKNTYGKSPVKLLDDKWQQLYAIYPHIHPFRDEREYLSIGPADFVLLPSRAYRAANNSFLLHGYYNYEHLILTRVEKRGEVLYYIGVPGNYYDREKQVAIMYGFESFECAQEPAQAGDFGYYMMRTEL